MCQGTLSVLDIVHLDVHVNSVPIYLYYYGDVASVL